MVKHVFVDANVFLSFYSLSEDTLTELDKLRAAAAGGQLRILVNKWLVDEIERNRERTIKDTLSRFESQKFETSIPRLAEGFKERDVLHKLYGSAAEAKKDLCKAIVQAASQRQLHADMLIQALLDKSKALKIDQDLLSSARLRMEKGDPPGKENSLGDRVHWECLLQHVSKHVDLIVVTGDKDFRSPLSNNAAHAYLQKEWSELKEAKLELHITLKSFIGTHFPNIDVAKIEDPLETVMSLVHSRSFADTHIAIAKLSKMEGFSKDEVDLMLKAALDNNQVSWILGDDDVEKFYKKLLDDYLLDADLTLYTAVSEQLQPKKKDDDLPF